MTATDNRTRTPRLPLLLLLFSLAAYLLPWNVSAINALTLGAYDLAEWLSLHPATHPLRIPSLLLRVQLVLITWLFALHFTAQPAWRRWFWMLMILVLSIAQLPPLDFLARPNDPNQQQQFVLAALSLVGAFVWFWVAHRLQKRWIILMLGMSGVATAAMGAIQGQALIQQYAADSTPGIGMPLLLLCYGMWIFQGMFRREPH